MAASSISETKRIRYLLDLCSPAEREHIEAEFFESEDAFEEMLTAEDDLIDAYARGKLAGDERRRFEKSFVSSLGGRDRVQFARALADAITATRPLETKFHGALLDIYRTFRLPGLLRIATIATAIVLIAVLAWLAIDRRRMTYELRELRVASAELSKRNEALQQSRDSEQTRTAETAGQLADQKPQPDKPRRRERGPAATERARHLPEVKNDREKLETVKDGPGEPLINTSDASLGNFFEPQKITQLPLNARNVANLLSLQPATTPGGSVAGGRSDQANLTLDGVDAGPINTKSLVSRNMSSSGEIIIRISSSLSWIRFHVPLETAALHEDYSVTIKTADGRLVTSVNWTEPLTPHQTIIDTPAISTADLPSGDYVLSLLGKEPDSSFVKVAEYSFKVIKY